MVGRFDYVNAGDVRQQLGMPHARPVPLASQAPRKSIHQSSPNVTGLIAELLCVNAVEKLVTSSASAISTGKLPIQGGILPSEDSYSYTKGTHTTPGKQGSGNSSGNLGNDS